MLVLLASVAPLTFQTNDVLDPCAAPCGLKTCDAVADLPCSKLSDGFGCAGAASRASRLVLRPFYAA